MGKMIGKNVKVMNFVTSVAFVAVMVFSSGGCAKKQVKTDEMGVGAPMQDKNWDSEPSEARVPRPRLGSEESLESTGKDFSRKPGPISEGRTSGPMLPVYFDFDSSNVKGEQMKRLEENGHFLKSNPRVRIRIEGNCDERGTEEYNLALGERRARNAKKFLNTYGINDATMTTISFGEEKPLHSGKDERSYSQNRRDDFVIVE